MAKKSLSAIRKAAILVTSIGKKHATTILSNISAESMQELGAEIKELGDIDPAVQQQVFEEFANMLSKGVQPRGGEDVARALLHEVVGEEEAIEILGKPKRMAFSSIVDVESEDLSHILAKEQPSVASMILSFLPPSKTAEVLSFLDDDMKEEVISRLAAGRKADPEIVGKIEKIFVDKVIAVIHTTKNKKNDELGGPRYVADVFQHIERALEDELMEVIQNVAPERAEEIRDLMFTFEDVIKLSDNDLQKVLRQVPMDKLVVALRGVEPKISDPLLRNLSKGAQETLKEESELLGKVKLSDVEAEQRNIVAIIRSLEAAGEIELSTGGDDDVYV